MPLRKAFAKVKQSQWALIALIVSVILFGITQAFLFALCAIASIAASFYFENKESKNSWFDLLHSLVVALAAWAVLTLVLNTTSPVNIITSCSMLPDFERGDLIFLAGGQITAPAVSMNRNLSVVSYDTFSVQDNVGNTVARIMQPTLEGKPLFEPKIGVCDRKYATGTTKQELCVKNLQFDNQTVAFSKQNSVIVYDSKTQAGLIVHRAVAQINASDGTYVLTKGDNNAFLDQQSGFHLIRLQDPQRVIIGLPFIGGLTTAGLQAESSLPHKGNVVLRIPYIGYIKLLLFLQIQAPAGCDSVLQGVP